MIAISVALIEPARRAGIPTPADPSDIPTPADPSDYDREEFVHWHLYCLAQLGQPMPSPDAHWENAKVVATLTEEECKTITLAELKKRGFAIGHSR